MRITDKMVAEHIAMIKEKTGEVVSWSEGYKSMHNLITVIAMLYLPEDVQEYFGVRGPYVPPPDLDK